ncbi:MAG: 50S ribosomal protein L21 [Candidatus Omnitrophica bacterium]|nr:50S ribosomal protein L21 [Candidatus Omnitrophota bacterium]
MVTSSPMSTSTFAIIQTGGKQYKVREGQTLDIELLPGLKDKKIRFDKVLLVTKDGEKAEVGKPFVKGAYCDAELLKEHRGPKKISFKYIRREKAATKIGHRQDLLRVTIKSIHGGK